MVKSERSREVGLHKVPLVFLIKPTRAKIFGPTQIKSPDCSIYCSHISGDEVATADFYEIFDRIGTHFVKRATFGSRYHVDTVIDRHTFNKSSVRNFARAATVFFK